MQSAERYGLDFALSMIKLRGFGGETRFWDYNLEFFTLMAGLASVTAPHRALSLRSRTLSIPPAIAARMAVTIDDISGGRFGLNIVTGWQRAEYEQMGLWPGEVHYARRYDQAAEYVQIMRELWQTGRSDFKGDFFQMDDCRSAADAAGADPHHLRRARARPACASPPESRRRQLLHRASASTRRRRIAVTTARLAAEVAANGGRDVGACLLFMVIADETDAAAMAKWQRYCDGIDQRRRSTG